MHDAHSNLATILLNAWVEVVNGSYTNIFIPSRIHLGPRSGSRYSSEWWWKSVRTRSDIGVLSYPKVFVERAATAATDVLLSQRLKRGRGWWQDTSHAAVESCGEATQCSVESTSVTAAHPSRGRMTC
ncbi:hypothetical protein FOZ62_015420, partial [Perkinsus olseni]